MALKPSDTYPGQVNTADPAYPHGKAQNQVVENDGTGTPWEQDLVNDLFGFQQALLDIGRVTPSGTPDKVGASDYITALKRMHQPLQALTWDQPALLGNNLFPIDPASAIYLDVSPNMLGATDLDKVIASADGGLTWGAVTLASPTSVRMLCAAAQPSGQKAIVTGSKAGGTDIQVNSAFFSITSLGSWAPITPPGTPTSLNRALYDTVNARFIVVGKTGSAPYIATCEAADLTTWTQRTVPASITGAVSAMSLARLGSTLVASWATQTKVAYSTDGGVTWTASTTSLTSDNYVIAAGETGFLAVGENTGNTYFSTDGATWTAKTALPQSGVAINFSGFAFIGGIFLVKSVGAGKFFYYSKDNGASWKGFLNDNKPWQGLSVIRSRLYNVRSIPAGGGTNDYYLDRSLAVDLP